jgi:hypothetical protein
MTAPALRVRAAVTCPAHPEAELIPGGARGICPVDGTSYQMETPEVTMTAQSVKAAA